MNPYQPGAGLRPPELAGREQAIDLFDIGLRRAEAGFAERSGVLYGLRGVGKTVLLNEFGRVADERRWLTIKLEAVNKEGLLPNLTAELHRTLRIATRTHGRDAMRKVLGAFKSFSMAVDANGAYGFGFDVAPEAGVADTGNLDVDLRELLQQLGIATRDLGIGTLLMIDEMQEAPKATLQAINTAIHGLGQDTDPLPVLLAGAGLPSLPGVLSQATSYAERLYDYSEIGALAPADADAALAVPARVRGVEWTEDALADAADFSHGYPYFIQTLGKHAWNAATDRRVTAEDVSIARDRARADVDSGLYRARWQRASAQQRQLLQAMAECAGDAPASVGEVAARIGRTTGQISVPRRELMDKGLIYSPAWGMLAFTVPGMDDYVLRQVD